MTLFDLIAALVLLVSGLVGFTNGAVRELVGIFAFVLAAAAAVFLLPFTGPLARHTVHPSWAANAAAIVTAFVLVYILLKVAGHVLTARLRDVAVLGAFDRIGGGLVGLARGLVLLGVFYLVYMAATPPELRRTKAQWIEASTLLPLARVSGHALQAFAPKGMAAAGRVGPVLTDAVVNGGDETPRSGVQIETGGAEAESTTAPSRPAKHRGAGYGRDARSSLDGLVERTR